MLAYCQERFDTVEINNSFYRLPVETALEYRRVSTPSNFLFAVKGSRFLTQMKKLKDPAAGIEKFFARVDLLKEKLGPVLDAFIEALPKWHRYALEFRDATWNTQAVYDVLRKHNAAYCAFHLAGYQSPIEITAS